MRVRGSAASGEGARESGRRSSDVSRIPEDRPVGDGPPEDEDTATVIGMPANATNIDPLVQKYFRDVAEAIQSHPDVVQQVGGIVHFAIGPELSFIVDLKNGAGFVKMGPPPSSGVDIKVTYKTVDDFNKINAGRLNFAKAIYQKRLTLRGNMRMLKRVQRLIEAVQQTTAAKARSSTRAGQVRRGPDGAMILRLMPRRLWMEDADCSSCQKCQNSFTFFRRRHHCRYCGKIFCQDCSSCRVGPNRICDLCAAEAYPDATDAQGAQLTSTRLTTTAELMGMNVATDGGDGESVGSVEGEAVELEGSAAARIAKLEATVKQLQAELLSEGRTTVPSPLTMLSHSELAVGLLYPILAIIAAVGWRCVPLTCFYLAWRAYSGGYGAWAWLPWLLFPAWILFVAQAPFMGLFRRRMQVYGIAFSAFCDYKIAQIQTRNVDEEEKRVVYDRVHSRTAARAYQSIAQLRGMWVKTGQYLSSRADIMPSAYVTVMSKLQDDLPPRPLEEVAATIQAGFNKPLDQVFPDFRPDCLAAASIGQVHKARLDDGSVVAVKVQHAGMDKLLRQDLDNLGRIASWLGWAEPSLDIKSVLEEWSKEVVKELDFENEAVNMAEVTQNMVKAGFNVMVPEIIPGLYSKKVLTMRFVDGIKVSDVAELDRLGVDKHRLVHDICTAYAHQIYCDGLFNGDPHPGNIMIVKRSQLEMTESAGLQPIVGATDATSTDYTGSTAIAENDDDYWVPVLLDFGLTKRLPVKLRLAFAKMVHSAETVDYGGVLEAFDEMGLQLGGQNASQDIENLQFMFRDAAPADEARKRFEEREKQKKAQEAKMSEEEKQAAKVASWPRELIFFMRTSELLQGLGSKLNVRHAYMRTMANAARRGLRESVPDKERARFPVWPHDSLAAPGTRRTNAQIGYAPPSQPNIPPLEQKVRRRLGAMFSRGAFLGLQVCVIRDNAKLVDVAAGELGPLNPRPVSPACVFPCLGASRFVAVSLVHALAAAGLCSYSQTVASLWPEFAGDKSNVTVQDLLRCRSGVEGWIPEKTGVRTLGDFQPAVKGVTGAPHQPLPFFAEDDAAAASSSDASDALMPEAESAGDKVHASLQGPSKSRESIAHLWFGWSWAIGGFVQAVAATHPRAALRAQLTEQLGVADEVLFGAPKDDGESKHMVDMERQVATLQLGTRLAGEGDDGDASASQTSKNTPLARMSSFKSDTPSSEAGSAAAGAGTGAGAGSSAPASVAGSDKQRPRSDSIGSLVDENEDDGEGEAMTNAMAALELVTVMGESGLEELAELRGKEFMMDPRLFNAKQISTACLPGSTVLASARGLANVAAWLIENQNVGASVPGPPAPQRAYGLGYRPFSFREASGQVRQSAFGCSALGGTTVLCDTKHRVAIAVTVNELTPDAHVVKDIVSFICQELELGTPIDL